MGPPGDEDPCMNMPPGEAQDECYINLDEDLGPEDAHCEEMHEGKNLPEPTEADIARYEAEYRANMKNGGPGRLNESTYAELQGKGFSRAEIDCHVGEMAEAAMHDALRRLLARVTSDVSQQCTLLVFLARSQILRQPQWFFSLCQAS